MGNAVEPYREFYGLGFPDVAHEHSIQLIDAHGERLVVQYFVPPSARGTVLVVHGYYDHVGLYGHLIEYLLSRDLAVVCYDQIGHGLSSGPRATIDSFDRYVAATRAVYAAARAHLGAPSQQSWHWIGQSMGGAVVMETLQQSPPAEHVGEIVLLAPLVRPYAWWFNRWVFAVAKQFIDERPRTITGNAENPEFMALQQVDPLQARVLPVAWVQAMVDWFNRFREYPESELAPKLVQGDADRTVDWRYTLKIYECRYPDTRHLVIPGGRHHLVNESVEIRQAIFSWLDEHCKWHD